MNNNPEQQEAKITAFLETVQPIASSEALGRMHQLLRNAFPEARYIALEFDGKLVGHIDLRTTSELDLAEARLPYLGGGHLFGQPRRGSTPLHPFHHRITFAILR